MPQSITVPLQMIGPPPRVYYARAPSTIRTNYAHQHQQGLVSHTVVPGVGPSPQAAAAARGSTTIHFRLKSADADADAGARRHIHVDSNAREVTVGGGTDSDSDEGNEQGAFLRFNFTGRVFGGDAMQEEVCDAASAAVAAALAGVNATVVRPPTSFVVFFWPEYPEYPE